MKRRIENDDALAEERFRQASRRMLFRGEATIPGDRIPGEGRSAAELPERHFRQKVTMNLDADIIAFFKERAATEKTPYQFLINQVLREYIHGTRPEQLAKAVGEALLSDESFCSRLRSLVHIDDE